MITHLHRTIKQAWIWIWEQADEAGFGQPLRQIYGRTLAEFVSRSGERGKGLNIIQVFYLFSVCTLTVQFGFETFTILTILAFPIVFPSLQKPFWAITRSLFQRFQSQEVFWQAEQPRLGLPKSRGARRVTTVFEIVERRVVARLRRPRI